MLLLQLLLYCGRALSWKVLLLRAMCWGFRRGCRHPCTGSLRVLGVVEMGLHLGVRMRGMGAVFGYLGWVTSVHLFGRGHFLAVAIGVDVLRVMDAGQDAVTLSHCSLLGVVRVKLLLLQLVELLVRVVLLVLLRKEVMWVWCLMVRMVMMLISSHLLDVIDARLLLLPARGKRRPTHAIVRMREERRVLRTLQTCRRRPAHN